MNSNGLKYDIVSAQEYPDEKSFKFRIRLLEHQTILENDYADLTKECAKMKRLYPNTAFTFGVRDSRGYLFWMNYTDTRRALFLEDLDDPEFINKWFDMYRARETHAFNPEVTTNLTKNVTGVFKVGTIVEIIFRSLVLLCEIMAFKRKTQTQYSSWKSGTSLSGKRLRHGGRNYKRRKYTLAQRVARLAADLKPETNSKVTVL